MKKNDFFKPSYMQGSDVMNHNRFSYPILFQVFIGILCLGLNVLTVHLVQTSSNPLFLDSVFTIMASFFGWISGLMVGFLSNFAFYVFLDFELESSLFTICSVSITLIVRLFLHNRTKISTFDLLSMYLLTVLVISLEGAILYTILYNAADFKEETGVRYFTLILVRQQIPLIFSAFLARIPINLIDKVISVFAGYLFYLGIDKLRILREKKLQEST